VELFKPAAVAHAENILQKLKLENPDPAGDFWTENDPVFEIWAVPQGDHFRNATVQRRIGRYTLCG
jgi:hypothetical protein